MLRGSRLRAAVEIIRLNDTHRDASGKLGGSAIVRVRTHALTVGCPSKLHRAVSWSEPLVLVGLVGAVATVGLASGVTKAWTQLVAFDDIQRTSNVVDVGKSQWHHAKHSALSRPHSEFGSEAAVLHRKTTRRASSCQRSCAVSHKVAPISATSSAAVRTELRSGLDPPLLTTTSNTSQDPSGRLEIPG